MRPKDAPAVAFIIILAIPLLHQPVGGAVPNLAEEPGGVLYREVYCEEKGLMYFVPEEETRAPSSLDISVYIPGTTVNSTGLPSWGVYSLGVVGEVVTFRTQAVNHGEVPAYNVTVTLTVYIWNGAGRIDGGKVVWSQRRETYVPPGDGSLSEPVFFNWTPHLSGPYIVNITFELKGDSRPRDNSAYYIGAVYEVGGKRRYSGVWIDRWIDSLEGETEITSLPSESWKRVPMPSFPITEEYSPPTVLYCGSLTNLSSNYDSAPRRILLPPFDLRELPDDYFDPLFLMNRPQAYLAYKFLGEVGAGGRLVNLISVDGGLFEPLLDPLGNPVVIDVNTSSGGTYRWLYPTHLDIFGNSFYPGIDLSRYAGHWVRVAIEYQPGPEENGSEMGYFLDDFILFMRESYESFLFQVSPEEPRELRLNPGESAELFFTVHFKRVKEPLPLKVSSSCDCREIEVRIEPEVIRDPAEGESIEVTVTFRARNGAPPGDHSVEISFAGGGRVLERWVNLTVPLLERISSTGGGAIRAPPEGEFNLTAEVVNQGNVPVSLRTTLYMPEGFSAAYGRELSLPVGESKSLKARVSYVTMPPGNYSLLWLFYPSDIEGVERFKAQEALDLLNESGRSYGAVEYRVYVGRARALYLKLLVPSMLVRYGGEPIPVKVPFILANRGNAFENLTLKLRSEDFPPSHLNFTPKRVSVPPEGIAEGEVEFWINGTLLHGTYLMNLYATEEGDEVLEEERFELTVHNLRLSSALYSSQGVSVSIIPGEIIRGRDSLLVVNATRSYPIETEEVTFCLKVTLGGAPYAERSWTLSSANSTLLKWLITFREAGEVTISLNVTWRVYGEVFHFTAPPFNAIVHRINVKVEDIFLFNEEGEAIPLEGNIKEGRYALGARIINTGDSEVKGFKVLFTIEYLGIRHNYTANVTLLRPGDSRLVTVGEVEIRKRGEEKVRIFVQVDPDAVLYEEDLKDNTMQRRVGVVEAKEPSTVQTTRYAYFTLVIIIVVLMVAITLRMVRRVMQT
ncbi:MAG: hypothetical protein J7K08_07595 [Thermoplasmata archaeon]|nr:hypothetical protein [Thermoplasmata archaeon]